METGLAGKVALVTGAAGGIGLASARALAAEGMRVALADLDGERVASEARLLGGTEVAVGLGVDVTDERSVAAVVSDVAGRLGGLDVLVTAAGVYHATPIDRITMAEWERVHAVNLTGTFLTAQAAMEVMAVRGGGRIVTIASLAGEVGGLEAGAGYASSKGGVIALTKSLARHGGPRGVTVNCVAPGFVDTPMTAGWPAEARARVLASTPLGRAGTPEEVAAIVVVLASGIASFVHGARIDVNGGLHMG
ncbi:MAG: SDR family oxidoreductase [Thermoleophilia bacterium]|nr:SDR family oxidoreductase [Thermoleophilia bacterium]